MKTNRTRGRHFTAAETSSAVNALLHGHGAGADLLGGRGGSNLGRPYLDLETRNGRTYWLIKRRGLPSIHTGILARDAMLASAELIQARWAWETYLPKATPTAH